MENYDIIDITVWKMSIHSHRYGNTADMNDPNLLGDLISSFKLTVQRIILAIVILCIILAF
jgi:hypothetical protein